MKYNYKSIILFIFLVITIIVFNSYTKPVIEGFAWTNDLQNRFTLYQNTVHPTTQFNLKMLQQQASPKEVEQLLKTGYWSWSDKTKYDYMDAIWKNKIIKIDRSVALDNAMKIYNETAIKQKLSLNTKEGQFIIYGGLIGEDQENNIKCVEYKNVSRMEKTTFTGYNLWNGQKNVKKEFISNDKIPDEMPGFNFVKGPCNPCSILTNPPDYSCPFTLNIEGNDEISPIWKELWQLG